MKWIKYLLISLLTLSVADVWACATPYASPRDYALYRVNDKEKIADKQYLYYHPSAEENCLAWQQLSDKTILPSDIYQVVYKMSLDDFEKMYHNREGNYGNSFAEWIIQKDTTLLQLLRVAKTNEYIRSKVNSRWYYPGMNLGTSMTLEDIVEVSLSITDERLRDRYLLQAVRALFTMWKYESCIELWEKEASLLPQNNIMRRLIEPYIAGAYYHVGQKDKALDYFVKSSDFESVFMCYDPKGDSLNLVDKIDIVCRYNPNAPILKNMLQEYILNLNPYSGYYELKYQVESKEFVQLLGLSQQLSADKRVKNKALWLYTTAFMQELLGNTQEASKWLSKAQKQRSNAFLAESMQVFRIFLDAKTSTYNQAYENKLLKQLKWL
ncbi:MAG: hypothetical protein J6V62_04115 [Paludibacteraceae bacterium]|nr:hypothetical protein [Paludibacteraceae bacterium]